MGVREGFATVVSVVVENARNVGARTVVVWPGATARATPGVLNVSATPPGSTGNARVELRARSLAGAICDALIVVEGTPGSLVAPTVDAATSLNRAVMAIPGQVTSTQSDLPNQLIQDGQAVLVTDARHAWQHVSQRQRLT